MTDPANIPISITRPRLSPAEEALEEADREIEELRRRLNAIITAFEKPGPHPEYHYWVKEEMIRRWPALTDAIRHAAVLDSLDEANGETTIPKEHQ